MKKLLIILFVSSAFATPRLAQMREPGPELKSLVEAERAFSKTSETRGIREAFLTYLADEAVVFRPHPVQARKWYQERESIPGLLTWEPVFADVSRAGDLGYTTGPYEFREKNAAAAPVRYGHFVSAWKKQPDGSWRVVVDLGTPHPRPETKPTGLSFPSHDQSASAKSAPSIDVQAGRAALLDVDRAFSRASASKGAVAAYPSYSSDAIRFYRINRFPTTGKEAVRAFLSGKPGLFTWQPAASDVSRSGDLGYTYGSSEFKKSKSSDEPAERDSYLRIWKKQADGRWKVVLDVASPIPPSAPAAGQ
jgi:ketosteroid isomerase-like protein